MIGDLYVIIFMIVIFGTTLYITRDRKEKTLTIKK